MAFINDLLSGLGTAANFIPGAGPLIGAGIGLINDLAGGDQLEEERKRKQAYRSPYEGYVASEISRLGDKTPSLQYQSARGDINRSYSRTVERFRNAPGIGGNAAVLAKEEELASRTQGDNLAKVAGAENERIQNNQSEAARLAMGQEGIDKSNHEFATDYNLNRPPSFLDSLSKSVTSRKIGYDLGYGDPNPTPPQNQTPASAAPLPVDVIPSDMRFELPVPEAPQAPMPLLDELGKQSPSASGRPLTLRPLNFDPNFAPRLQFASGGLYR